MIPIWATITSREVVEFDDYIRHPGQEFVLVLAGKVRIQFENGDSVVLSKLESAYFDSGIGHVLPDPEQAARRGAGGVQRRGRDTDAQAYAVGRRAML